MMDGELLREFCAAVEQSVEEILPQESEEREDSRAFGAAIEKPVRDEWLKICDEHKWVALDPPGVKDIGDVSCRCAETLILVDVKTHNLDPKRYADGGVCSVDNLLRLLAGTDETGLLVVLEVAHRAKGKRRERRSVTAVPFHCLPIDAMRIANLGTGQLRLNTTVSALASRVDWKRTVPEFLKPFVTKAKSDYDRVIEVAGKRRDHLEAFARGGYRRFKSVR